MTQVLTHNECSLLQRYYDGDPLEPENVALVEQLLNTSTGARVFMSALEELTLAICGAEQALWENATPPTVDAVVEAALNAATLAEQPLEELAPLLERFFDGEAMGEEIAAVQALINERDEVADYLAELDGLRASVIAGHDQLIGDVSFDGFWDTIAEQLGDDLAPVVATSYDDETHRVLLYRFFDDEVDAAERAQVEGWIADGDTNVVSTLAALAELRFATTTAVETAQEKVDLSTLWHRIEDAIDDQIEAQGDNVVSLARKQRDRQVTVGDSRSIVLAALAAMLFLAFGAGIFKEQLFGPAERVIVEKTVVIVDSVEYEPGNSVMVNSPMRSVSSISATPEPGAPQVEDEPTVIWLLDSEPAPYDEAEPAEPAQDDSKMEPADQPI